jgi:hypothetical protein
VGAGASTKPNRQHPDGLYWHNRPQLGPGPALRAGHSVCISSRSTAQGPPCWPLCCCTQRRGRCLLLRHSPHPAHIAGSCCGQREGGHSLRAVVGAPVRPSGPSHPPPAACGPHPCPPWAACRRPPRPSPCGGWPGCSRCTGAPLRNARPSPCGAACSGPCIAPPPCRLRRRCSGAARPPQSGGCGAVRPSGPALRAGVAARGPSLGVPPPSRAGAPAAGCCCSPCPCGGPQSKRRPLGPRKRGLCPLCGRLGREDTPAAAGYLTGDLMPRPSPCGAACSGP